MKKYLSIAILALSLFTMSGELKAEAATQQERIQLSKEMDRFYRREGYKRGAKYYRQFLWSASRAAKWFPMYPAKSPQDRMVRFLCYSGVESRFNLGMTHINVPGVKYFGGTKKVKFYSVDFGHPGLSEQNVDWTYSVAKALQEGKPIPRGIGTRAFRNALKDVKIPKNIKLKKIDLTDAIKSRRVYQTLTAVRMDPELIRKSISVPFDESTQDDIDSMLIYRILVELDRYYRGWNYDTWDKELYEFLSQYVE